MSQRSTFPSLSCQASVEGRALIHYLTLSTLAPTLPQLTTLGEIYEKFNFFSASASLPLMFTDIVDYYPGISSRVCCSHSLFARVSFLTSFFIQFWAYSLVILSPATMALDIEMEKIIHKQEEEKSESNEQWEKEKSTFFHFLIKSYLLRWIISSHRVLSRLVSSELLCVRAALRVEIWNCETGNWELCRWKIENFKFVCIAIVSLRDESFARPHRRLRRENCEKFMVKFTLDCYRAATLLSAPASGHIQDKRIFEFE